MTDHEPYLNIGQNRLNGCVSDEQFRKCWKDGTLIGIKCRDEGDYVHRDTGDPLICPHSPNAVSRETYLMNHPEKKGDF